MSDVFKKFAALREKYPESDDVERLLKEEEQLSALLQEKEYFSLPTTQKFVSLCRSHIKDARKLLCSDKTLIGNEAAQRDLWSIIEAREWFLRMVVRDYDGEIANIEAELEHELER